MALAVRQRRVVGRRRAPGDAGRRAGIGTGQNGPMRAPFRSARATAVLGVAVALVGLALLLDAVQAWASVADAANWRCGGLARPASWEVGRWLPPAVSGLAGCAAGLRGRRVLAAV